MPSVLGPHADGEFSWAIHRVARRQNIAAYGQYRWVLANRTWLVDAWSRNYIGGLDIVNVNYAQDTYEFMLRLAAA